MGSAGQRALMAFAWHRLNRVPYRRLLLVGLLSCVCSFPVWADERPTPKSLWQTVLPPPTAYQPPTPRRPWVLRDREITLDLSLLQILKDAGARPHPRISVELFDGANHELDVTSTLSRSNDSAVIRGTFKPPSTGDFTFSINGSVMAATIHVGDRLFAVEHVSNGRHRLLELNPATVPPD